MDVSNGLEDRLADPNLAKGVVLSPRRLWSFIFQPRKFYTYLREEFGHAVRLRLPHTHLFMTMSSENAEEILRRPRRNYEAFQKEAFHGLFEDGSVFVLEGEEHHCERQLLMPAFHHQSVHRYAPIIAATLGRHMERWQAGQEIKAELAMLAVSRDVILQVVFGSDYGDVGDEGRRLLERQLPAETPLIFYVPHAQGWWSPPWWLYRWHKRRLMAFIQRALDHRRASGKQEADVLGLLVEARDETGAPKSDQVICNEVYSILMPGHATTGVAMGWALYELARHPSVAERLRREVAELGPNPELEAIAGLPYLDAVCKESMRLHTIVTETARRSVVPQELRGQPIPHGTGLGISMYAIHHDPDLYPEPYAFRPERFLEREYGIYEFLPFGGGHRRCLGAALSDFEMRLTVAQVIRQWDFEVLQEEVDKRHDLGLGGKYGMRLRLRHPRQ